MLNVFITVDVEIWCDGWQDLDARFSDSFSRYIYGRTDKGDYGLPIQMEILRDNGLQGVFFVEPLFAGRFGVEPLQEIVALLNEGQQEIQLHLHTEWADEVREEIVPSSSKRPNLKDFSREHQSTLIGEGKRLLTEAGAENITAFRAGNFGANFDTLKALEDNKINIDSSYNYARMHYPCALDFDHILFQPEKVGNIIEYPMSFFNYGKKTYRHAQLGACSTKELTNAMQQAQDKGWDSFVLLSHSFELLNRSKRKPDGTVVKRFEKICQFLSRNSDSFNCTGFKSSPPPTLKPQPIEGLRSSTADAAFRMIEQLARRRHA